jgi:hypothetical protein
MMFFSWLFSFSLEEEGNGGEHSMFSLYGCDKGLSGPRQHLHYRRLIGGVLWAQHFRYFPSSPTMSWKLLWRTFDP